jgi:hypothetical protein
MDRSTPTTPARVRAVALLAFTFLLSFALGAYLDWVWWPVYSGFMLSIVAVAVIATGSLIAVAGRRMVRRGGLAVLAVGVGLLAGQNLGPTREPLIVTEGGTMTLRLEAPITAFATGTASCANVASETEFQVDGQVELRLTELDRVWYGAYVDIGDRWAALDGGPRSEGVRLMISGTGLRIPDDGAPANVIMEATPSSALDVSVGIEGGSIRFAGLAGRAGPDLTGEPWDLVGTLEWTCGDPASQPEG